MTGLTQVALAGGLAVVLASAATPTFAAEETGLGLLADFEEVAPGASTLYYPGYGTSISGGVVTAGGEFTPHSGANVYVGRSIGTRQDSTGGGYSPIDWWSNLSAYVSPGADTVFVSFYGYFPDAPHALIKLGAAQTVGQEANQFFAFEDDAAVPWQISMSFRSASPFAVDDLVFAGGGIPEPGTWALMILGFGAAGAALRRRRRTLRPNV